MVRYGKYVERNLELIRQELLGNNNYYKQFYTSKLIPQLVKFSKVQQR